jgi:hypothetical protein
MPGGPMLPRRSPKDTGVRKARMPKVPADRAVQEGYADRSRDLKSPQRRRTTSDATEREGSHEARTD